MFERYTEKARRVIFFASYVASQFGSPDIETAHLLRSPKNAKRLMAALQRARGKKLKTQTIDKLRRDFGLAKEA